MATISGHLAELGYGKYLIVAFLGRFGGISGWFGLAMGIWAGLPLAKVCTNHGSAKLTWYAAARNLKK